jgi:hypothetical protein
MRAVLAMAAALSVLLVATAGAVPQRPCSSGVTVKGTSYLVIVHGVSCSFGRKTVRGYLRHHSHPKHYSCKGGAGTNVAVNCQGSTKPKGDTAFRYVYGVRQ